MNNTNFSKLALIAAAITLAQTGQATEFSAAFIGSSAYNSNVFGTDGDEDSDMLLEAGTELELRSDPERRLDYLLNYRGDYQSYAEADEANAMEHRQRFRLRYDIDPITQIILNQRYRDVSNLQFDLADFDSGDTGIDISQNRYERNDISVDLTRELSRRWSVSGNLGYQTIDFKRNINRSDSDTTEVGVTVNYLLSDKQEARINAIEFLDNLLTGDLKRRLLPIIEESALDVSSEEELQKIKHKIPTELECFQLLLEGNDLKAKLAVLFLIKHQKDPKYLPIVKKYVVSDDIKIRTFAKDALEALQ